MAGQSEPLFVPNVIKKNMLLNDDPAPKILLQCVLTTGH